MSPPLLLPKLLKVPILNKNMKYWNKSRVKRVRERRRRDEGREIFKDLELARLRRTYTEGDSAKNAALMLEVLGSTVNRKMLARLLLHGAVSITFLVDPFNLTLPAAVVRVNALERVGLITTKKQGRIRFCIYNPKALKELAHHLLSSKNPFL
jgi:DNA-binding transcriptional ArsR family regulator